VLRIDVAESGLSKTNSDLFRKAMPSASLPLMAKVTAPRFDGERRTSSKISPDCSPS
jgi:hypothetical protein